MVKKKDVKTNRAFAIVILEFRPKSENWLMHQRYNLAMQSSQRLNAIFNRRPSRVGLQLILEFDNSHKRMISLLVGIITTCGDAFTQWRSFRGQICLDQVVDKRVPRLLERVELNSWFQFELVQKSWHSSHTARQSITSQTYAIPHARQARGR